MQLKIQLIGRDNVAEEFINLNSMDQTTYSQMMQHPDTSGGTQVTIRIKAMQPDYNWLNSDEEVGNVRMGNKRYTIVTNKFFNEIDDDVYETIVIDNWIKNNFHWISKWAPGGEDNMQDYSMANWKILYAGADKSAHKYFKVRVTNVEIENIYEVVRPYRRYHITLEEL